MTEATAEVEDGGATQTQNDADVLANASSACKEIRAMVDHQVTVAQGLDTKARALLTVVVAIAAIVAPRVRLDTPAERVAGLVTLLIAAALAVIVLASLWPRDCSYGADPEALVASLEKYPPG